MFSHKSFLKLGTFDGTDIVSMLSGGMEVVNCEYSFQQGIDDKGKVATRVSGGAFRLTLPMTPPDEIIEWAFNARRYQKGVIVTFNDENEMMERLMFNNAACVHMSVSYTQSGKSYVTTEITIQAEEIKVGAGALNFTNEWTFNS